MRTTALLLIASLIALNLAGCASQGSGRQFTFYDYDRFNRKLGPDGLYENPVFRCYESENDFIGPVGLYDIPSYRDYERGTLRLGPDGLYEPQCSPYTVP